MTDLKTIVKLAIQRKELSLLMLGNGMYSEQEIKHSPLHAYEVLKIIYELHGEVPGIEYVFEKALSDLINRKSIDSFYIGLKYQLAIYDCEKNNTASFKIQTSHLSSLLHQSYSVNKHKLEKMYEIPRLGVKCSSEKGISKNKNMKTKVEKLNMFSIHIYDKPLI